MHEFVSFNRQIISARKSFLSAISSAALYGKGVFTTVAIYDAKPFLLEKHRQRLTANAEKIGIDLSEFSAQTIENSLSEIIRANKITNGRARLTFSDESASRIWQSKSKHKTSFLIQTADFRAVPENFRLTVSPFPVNSKSPLAGVKSCNYLENILALDDAKEKIFDEAIRLNERGEIVSACMANVFWLKDGKIFTPDLKTGCLAGTTRAFVSENFPVCEINAQIEEIAAAKAIFLTSAGIGVVQVVEFQEKKISRQQHELARIIGFRKN